LENFGFALFVRGYYGWDPATEDGFILSGGSDSYYHNWVTTPSRLQDFSWQSELWNTIPQHTTGFIQGFEDGD